MCYIFQGVSCAPQFLKLAPGTQSQARVVMKRSRTTRHIIGAADSSAQPGIRRRIASSVVQNVESVPLPSSRLSNAVVTPAQVHAVRHILFTLGLPAELVLTIMDLGNYYPAVRARRMENARIHAYDGAGVHAAQLYLFTPPLPQTNGDGDELARVVKVTWLVEGHDQGWGGEAPGEHALLVLALISDSRLTISVPTSGPKASTGLRTLGTRRAYFAAPALKRWTIGTASILEDLATSIGILRRWSVRCSRQRAGRSLGTATAACGGCNRTASPRAGLKDTDSIGLQKDAEFRRMQGIVVLGPERAS